MKQVGDDFFESKVPKVRFGRRAPNDHRAFKRFFLCSAGRNDYAVRVPNIGMCLCVMRLTILLSLRAIKLSRCGVVAQLVEHHNGIVGVVGSIPIGSTSSLFVGAAESFYVRPRCVLLKERLP